MTPREESMSSNGHPVIHLEEVTKVFYTDEVETHALSGIHLAIASGEYVSIAGPSGCGKSTLLSILGLLDTPTAGRYCLNGKPAESLTLSERARIRNREIGFIFQSFNLIGDLSVYENVELPLTYRGMPASERKQARAGGAREGRHGAPHEALPVAALRRPAAARRRRPRHRRQAARPARRRADRKPRFGQRRGRDGAAPRPAPRGVDDLHGHPRPALRAARRTHDPPLRRPRRRGREGQERVHSEEELKESGYRVS